MVLLNNLPNNLKAKSTCLLNYLVKKNLGLFDL